MMRDYKKTIENYETKAKKEKKDQDIAKYLGEDIDFPAIFAKIKVIKKANEEKEKLEKIKRDKEQTELIR